MNTQNIQPLVIKIVDNLTASAKLKFKRLLLKINYIKHDKNRRNSQIKVTQGRNYKLPQFFQQQDKKSQIKSPKNIQSPLTASKKGYPIRPPTQLLSKPISKVQTTKQQKIPQKSLSPQKKNQSNSESPPKQTFGYFNDFDKVLNSAQQQQDKQQIDLNDSFQKMNEKTSSQQQKQRKQKVNENKRRRDKIKKLKQKLDQVLYERQQLLQTNTRLKQQIDIMSRNSNQNVVYNLQTINQAKAHLQYLKNQYERLCDQKGINSKRSTKYKSQNTIYI